MSGYVMPVCGFILKILTQENPSVSPTTWVYGNGMVLTNNRVPSLVLPWPMRYVTGLHKQVLSSFPKHFISCEYWLIHLDC